MAGSKHLPPEAKAAKYEPRRIVTTFEGLVEALKRETEKLRAVDTYLNEEGKHRLATCEQIAFLTDFCNTASELAELDLHDELGDDADIVRDILMAVDRIAKLDGVDAVGGVDGKTYALTASYSGSSASDPLTRRQRTMVPEAVCVAERGRYVDGVVKQHLEARSDGKTNTLTTVQKDNNIAEPVRVANINKGGQGDRIYATDAKSCAIKAQGGGAGGHGQGLYAVPIKFEGDVPTQAKSSADGKIYPVYKVTGGKITIKDRQYDIKLPDGYYIIRKLTVRECKRLQTVPEWYEFPVSDAQAYKMLGNGWTVKVISHLIDATVAAAAAQEMELTDLSDAPAEIKEEIIRNAERLENHAPAKTALKVRVRVRVRRRRTVKV